MGCWPNRIVSRCPHWISPNCCDFLTHFSLASGCLAELQNTSPNNKGNNDSNNSSRRKDDSCNQSGRKLGHRGWELGVEGGCCYWQESRLSLKRFWGCVYKRTPKYPTWDHLCAHLPRWHHHRCKRDNTFWKPRQYIYNKSIDTQPGRIRLKEKETHIS